MMIDPAAGLLLPVLTPLLAVALLAAGARRTGAVLLVLAPLTALGGLVLAGETLQLPWLLLDTRLAADPLGQAVLLLAAPVAAAALLFAVAGEGGRGGPPLGLRMGLGATVAAFMGVVLAADLATFYFAYATMTLVAYPLVVHFRTPEAFRAGRVYLGMAVLAEAAVLAAVLLIAAQGGNAALAEVPALVVEHPYRNVLVALIGLGFAVKAGVVPLHAWLALAHPAAPVPASALLSALLVKAALVAWWRLLPIGDLALPVAGGVLVVAGLANSLYASVVGVTQRRAKTVLAYSTVSQMGLMTAFTGTALLEPALAGAALTGVALFALHHGLAKGALFLGCGLHGRHRGAYLLLPALALVGVPATSGALAKGAGKQLGAEALGAPAEPLLLLASALTAVLMIRFLLLAWRGEGGADPLARRAAVLALVLLSLTLPWLAAAVVAPQLVGYTAQPAALLDALLPALAGGAVAAVLFGLAGAARLPRIPEGDWIKPALLVGVRLGHASRRAWRRLPARPRAPSLVGLSRLSAAVESRLLALAMAGVLFLLLVLGIALLGILAGG